MYKKIILTLMLTAFIPLSHGESRTKYYGTGLCDNPDYKCVKISHGTTWEKMFPNEKERDIVQRVNRSDTYLWRGKEIAIPQNLDHITKFDVSPFPMQINEKGNKVIIVDQDNLAWGAYNKQGKLVNWGPISSGKNYCPDIKKGCTTVTGIFYVFNKQDAKCKSNIYPVGRGGSKMPYCMFFYKGYALHGSHEVVGHRASHGCVRIFKRDAKWLNETFVELSDSSNGFKGTKVIVQKISNFKQKK